MEALELLSVEVQRYADAARLATIFQNIDYALNQLRDNF